MPYTLFVSHTNMDVNLARAVSKEIQDAFGENIKVYFAADHILGGERWKHSLKTHLGRSDAIVSIMTPEALPKPWLYIEWSAFWLNDRTYFVLLAEGVGQDEITEGMRDSQMVDLHDAASIRKLLSALCLETGTALSDDELEERSSSFLAAVESGRQSDVARSRERYAEDGAQLPEEEKEQRRILEYFYKKGDVETFRRLFRQLDGDGFRADLALWIVRNHDAVLAAALCEEITASDHKSRVASGMIRAGYADADPLRRVVDGIPNSAEKRRLAVELLDQGMAEADVLRYLVGKIDNMAELRRVGMRLVERAEFTTPIYEEVVATIARMSATHLRDVALEFVRQGSQAVPAFERIMDILIPQKPSAAIPVLEALQQADPAMLPPLHERHAHLGPNNSAVAWLRKALGLDPSA